jgi:hypothetical protein
MAEPGPSLFSPRRTVDPVTRRAGEPDAPRPDVLESPAAAGMRGGRVPAAAPVPAAGGMLGRLRELARTWTGPAGAGRAAGSSDNPAGWRLAGVWALGVAVVACSGLAVAALLGAGPPSLTGGIERMVIFPGLGGGGRADGPDPGPPAAPARQPPGGSEPAGSRPTDRSGAVLPGDGRAGDGGPLGSAAPGTPPGSTGGRGLPGGSWPEPSGGPGGPGGGAGPAPGPETGPGSAGPGQPSQPPGASQPPGPEPSLPGPPEPTGAPAEPTPPEPAPTEPSPSQPGSTDLPGEPPVQPPVQGPAGPPTGPTTEEPAVPTP